MITKLVQQWDKNKNRLEEYFRTTEQKEYDSYEIIVKMLFKYVINHNSKETFDVKKMTIIDDGNYKGTQIFIIPKDTYQPNVDDYLITNTYYGSCSGCDTLQGICHYEDGFPNEEQVREYMMLALHFIQKMKYLSDTED